ncbi:MAG: hypothetical protein MR804_08110 [Limosilactobacillus reuteri]|nr:hypothetical protein [Limosilactobacillus reuteri]
MNEIETKSFEVVPVMIEVIDNQTGSKSIIRKYYSLGQKKNGDKYFKITGITEFYKQHAKNLQKVDYRMKLATQLVVNKKRHSA